MTDSDPFQLAKCLKILLKLGNDLGKLKRRLRRHRHTALVIYGAEYDRLFFQHLIADINEAAGSAGIDVLHLGATGTALQASMTSLKTHRPDVDGIIVLPTTFCPLDKAAIIRFLGEMKLPTTILDKRENFQAPLLAKTAYRYFDNNAAAKMFAERLGQITLVQQDVPLSVDEQTRISAFKKFAPISVSSLNPREDAFEIFLSLDIAETTDIVCMNDDQAIGIDDALYARAVISPPIGKVNVWSYDCCASMDARIQGGQRYFRGGVRQSTKMLAKEGIDALSILINGGSPDSEPCSPTWHGPKVTEGSFDRR